MCIYTCSFLCSECILCGGKSASNMALDGAWGARRASGEQSAGSRDVVIPDQSAGRYDTETRGHVQQRSPPGGSPESDSEGSTVCDLPSRVARFEEGLQHYPDSALRKITRKCIYEIQRRQCATCSPEAEVGDNLESKQPDPTNAWIVYPLGPNEEVHVPDRPEYKCKSLIEHLDNHHRHMGRDGYLFRDGDHEVVWCVEKQKVMQLDYCLGDHKLCFRSGETSIAPIFLTTCDEFVFAYDVIFLRGKGKRVGPVARALGGLVRAFRQSRRVKRQRLF